MKTIAITQRVERNRYGKEVDSLEHDYVNYYAKFGVVLIPIPNSLRSIKSYLSNLCVDGIILSGGGDIYPSLYRKTPRKGFEYFPERDILEKKILKFAIKNDIPVLGECRGMQFLNTFFGGSLLNGFDKKNIQHAGTRHTIKIVDNSSKEYLNIKSATVNSFHNYSISRNELSTSLRAFAEAADGTIEGVYYPGKALAGIMWHPEREKRESLLNIMLVESFIKRKLYWSKK